MGEQGLNERLFTLQHKHDLLEQKQVSFTERMKGLENELARKEEELSSAQEDLKRQARIHRKRSVSAGSQDGNASDDGEALVATADEVAEFKLQITDLRAELRAAQTAAKEQAKYVIEYKTIAQANEDALAKVSESHEALKSQHEELAIKSRNDVDAIRETLQASINDLTKAKDVAEKNANAATSKLDDAIERARVAEENAKGASEREAKMKADVNVYIVASNEANANYQRELQLHAEDSKLLAVLRKEKSTKDLILKENDRQVATLTATLANMEQSHKKDIELLESELTSSKARNKEMENRNKVLHEQIDTLTARTEKLIGDYNVDDVDDTGSPDSGDGTAIVLEQTQQSEAQLRRLVKYLRNEKQVIQAEMELAKSERLRAKHRADLLERQLDEARIQIMSHSEADSSGAKAAEERQAKLMKQTQQISLLEESNMYLKQTAMVNEEKAKELEEKVADLEKKLKPTEKKLRDAIAERDAAISDRTQAEEEKEMWQSRVNHMVSKYHQIDPAIHQEKMQELEETKEELDSLNKAYAKMRQTIMPKLKNSAASEKQRAEKASKELKTAKETIETLKQEVSSLEKSNERLRKVANLLKQQKQQSKKKAGGNTRGGRITPVSSGTSASKNLAGSKAKDSNDKNLSKNVSAEKKERRATPKKRRPYQKKL